MPSDLHTTQEQQQQARRRQAAQARRRHSSGFPLTPFQTALLFLLCFCWSFASIHYHLPPYSWVDQWKHRHDKVVQHRPSFKKVERYSKEHRYRPATSPVIRKVGKDGKEYLHGQYH
ncbi:hypothetical protein ACM66B_002311 [Microbotryomycetes sp. NB124-2]